jgi:colanic acid biosynthesis glycosyl transferase WcaI
MARFLFVNRVYPPVGGATGQLLWELTAAVAAAGHEVTVMTMGGGEAPRPDGVTVVRIGGAKQGGGLVARAVGYVGQHVSLVWALRNQPAMDVWVSMTDPPMQAVSMAWFCPPQTRLVHWAQDVYPEVAEEVGVLPRGGWAAQIFRHLARWALRRHDTVVAVGRCMADRLQARDPGSPRPEVIPNWAPLPEPASDDAERREAFRQRLAPPGRRIIMYSGNFGRAHSFEAVAEAVRATAMAGSSWHWVFIGDGPRWPWLLEAVGGSPNTTFLPPQPWNDLRVSLAAADLHLASMESNLTGLVVPSKVYGALALGRPCLLLGPADGEAARLVIDSGAGRVLAAASGPELAAVLDHLERDAAAWAAMVAAAQTVAPDVSRARGLARWLAVLTPPVNDRTAKAERSSDFTS